MITATLLVVKTKPTARNSYLTWAFIPFLEKGADTLSLTPPPPTTARADTLSQNRDPSVRADREPESVPAQATVGRFLPDEHGAAGRRAHRRNGQVTPVRSSYTRSSSQRRRQPCKPEPPANPPIKTQPNEAPPQATPQTPTPQRTHRSSPYPPPKHPGKNAKIRRTAPGYAGPSPRRHHLHIRTRSVSTRRVAFGR